MSSAEFRTCKRNRSADFLANFRQKYGRAHVALWPVTFLTQNRPSCSIFFYPPYYNNGVIYIYNTGSFRKAAPVREMVLRHTNVSIFFYCTHTEDWRSRRLLTIRTWVGALGEIQRLPKTLRHIRRKHWKSCSSSVSGYLKRWTTKAVAFSFRNSDAILNLRGLGLEETDGGFEIASWSKGQINIAIVFPQNLVGKVFSSLIETQKMKPLDTLIFFLILSQRFEIHHAMTINTSIRGNLQVSPKEFWMTGKDAVSTGMWARRQKFNPLHS